MLKYILSAILAVSLMACGGDDAQDQMGDEQPMGEQAPDQQAPDQQAPDQQAPMGEGEADVDVSDEELQAFFDAAMIAQEVQGEYQQDMEGILADEGLEMETYSQIYQTIQMGQDPDEAGISSEDMERFESADAKLDELGAEMESAIDQALADEGVDMDLDRFEEINMAIEQSPELQQRLQQMMMEEEGMPDQGQQPQPEQQPEPDQY